MNDSNRNYNEVEYCSRVIYCFKTKHKFKKNSKFSQGKGGGGVQSQDNHTNPLISKDYTTIMSYNYDLT